MKSMKIGILTFFNAHNYGAVLQAYALKNYVSSLGHNCIIINYRNKYIEKAYPYRLKPRIRKKDFINPKRFRANKKEIDIWLSSRKSWTVQYRKFEDFINSYLLDGMRGSWKEQINQCDLILFGSDQIWEKNITGPKDKIFIGDFQTKATKVCYAASCYSEQSAIDDNLIQSLRNFKNISVRENKLAEMIKSRLGKNYEVEVVVDPVFLPDRSIYYSFLTEPKCSKQSYILFYLVSESEELSKISEYLRIKCNKNILEIHYYKNKNQNNVWQRADVGPQEFVELIKNAEYIFTNSFHGTAFSMIFHKQFIVVNHNIRIHNLLYTVGLESREILSLEEFINMDDSEIPYEEVQAKINQMLEISKQFLYRALAIE